MGKKGIGPTNTRATDKDTYSDSSDSSIRTDFSRNNNGQTCTLNELKDLALTYSMLNARHDFECSILEVKEKYLSKLETVEGNKGEYLFLCMDAIEFFFRFNEPPLDIVEVFYKKLKDNFSVLNLIEMEDLQLISKIIKISRKIGDDVFSDDLLNKIKNIERLKIKEIIEEESLRQGPSGESTSDFDVSLIIPRISSAVHWFKFAGKEGIFFAKQELCIVADLYFNSRIKDKFIYKSLNDAWAMVFGNELSIDDLKKQKDNIGIKNEKRD